MLDLQTPHELVRTSWDVLVSTIALLLQSLFPSLSSWLSANSGATHSAKRVILLSSSKDPSRGMQVSTLKLVEASEIKIKKILVLYMTKPKHVK